MSGKFIIGLTTLYKYLGKLYFLNKELQAKEIDWTDVQYELTRTRDSINNMKDEDIFIKSKEISRKTGNPLALCDTMPIHNTRATTGREEFLITAPAKLTTHPLATNAT